jgi:hypothetical protein
MVFLDADLLRYFSNGRSSEMKPFHTVLSAMGGVLAIDGDRYEKIQIYTGRAVFGGFRVTSGWRETGTFQREEQALVLESMCAIGPGYQTEGIDITPNSPAGAKYLVESFEPNLFVGKTSQENVNWL